MHKKNNVSVIYVNYRTKELLRDSIASLRSHEPDIGEVVVVNNSPQEDLSDVDGVDCVLTETQNRGFGAGCNRGPEQATGKILLFLNPDTYAETPFIDTLLREGERPDVWIVAPDLYRSPKEREEWCAGTEFPSPVRILTTNIEKRLFRSFRNGRNVRIAWSPVGRVRWTSGAAFMIEKEVFHTLKGFDEGFFLYYEDIDLCRRVYEHGGTVFRSDKVFLLHRGGQERQERLAQKQAYFASQDRYIEKYYGARWVRFLRVLRTMFRCG